MKIDLLINSPYTSNIDQESEEDWTDLDTEEIPPTVLLNGEMYSKNEKKR